MSHNVERGHPSASELLERIARCSRQVMAGHNDAQEAIEEAAATFWGLPSETLEEFGEWAVWIAADPAETDERRCVALALPAVLRTVQASETSVRDALLNVGLAARYWEVLR